MSQYKEFAASPLSFPVWVFAAIRHTKCIVCPESGETTSQSYQEENRD
jgi:hypothetical protein